MDRLLTEAFWVATISGGIRLATPLTLASVGETISQRAGVLNLGLEGYMIVGALGSLYTAAEFGNVVGLVAGALAGVLLSLVMVGLSVKLGANQVVVGFAITIFAVGLTGYLYRVTTRIAENERQVSRLGELDIPGLSHIPFFGDAFFGNNWITWLAVFLTAGVYWVGTRTQFGLSLRAVGEDPDSSSARGVPVVAIRSRATLISGLCGGLGGAALMIGQVGRFQPGITANRGFIALIVIIMASWSIWGAAAGAFAFGFFEALGVNLRNVVSDSIPTEALSAIPFIMALILLAISARRSRMPASLGVNYIPDK